MCRKHYYSRHTLSTTFGLFLDGHCACCQLRKASSISTFLHFPGANQRSVRRCGGMVKITFALTSAICAPLCSLVFFETFVRDTTTLVNSSFDVKRAGLTEFLPFGPWHRRKIGRRGIRNWRRAEKKLSLRRCSTSLNQTSAISRLYFSTTRAMSRYTTASERCSPSKLSRATKPSALSQKVPLVPNASGRAGD